MRRAARVEGTLQAAGTLQPVRQGPGLTTALKCLAIPRTSAIVEKWKPVDIKFFREDFLSLSILKKRG